jgi:hypothetical protein
MNKSIGLFFILLLLLGAGNAFAQELQEEESDTEDLIQFSGVIMTSDSLKPIPLAHIIIPKSMLGTVSNFNGYFSFVARKLDTVEFTAMGYKDVTFVIPDTIEINRYSIIQLMSTDTIYLNETVIYPWPTKEEFKDAFLNLKIPDDELEIARKNLDTRQLYMLAENMTAAGSEGYRYQVQQRVEELYYNGQTQPITIMNPFAWAKFIKSWRDGDFKRKNIDP